MQIGRPRHALVVLIGVVTIAACGSDGAKTVSRRDFVAQADAICRSTDAKVSALHDRLGDPQDDAAVLSLVHQAAEIQLSAIERIRAVGLPDADAASVESLFNEAEVLFKAARSAESRADVERMDKDLNDLDVHVRAWGFKSCGGNA